jgi:hypothetical protein
MHLKTTTRRGAMLAAAAAALLLSSPHARAQAGAAPARPAAAAVAPGSPANLDSLLERANRSRTRGAETALPAVLRQHVHQAGQRLHPQR